jgi:hypothetical protein
MFYLAFVGTRKETTYETHLSIFSPLPSVVDTFCIERACRQ